MTNKSVKCIVWDLDNTLWQGTLAENDLLTLNHGIVNIIKELDEKGILHSIASRNDFAPAWAQLQAFGIDHLFLHPQIHWHPKSMSVKTIADTLNLALDNFYFVDDQPFELKEVKSVHPQVRCYSVSEIHRALEANRACFPKQVTKESQQRRLLYATELKRTTEQASYSGDIQAFLKSLNLRLFLAPLQEPDLARAQELTERTHQLNTTGYTFSMDQLRALIASPRHQVFQSSLKDRFGDYGIVGLCITEQLQEALVSVKKSHVRCVEKSRTGNS